MNSSKVLGPTKDEIMGRHYFFGSWAFGLQIDPKQNTIIGLGGRFMAMLAFAKPTVHRKLKRSAA